MRRSTKAFATSATFAMPFVAVSSASSVIGLVEFAVFMWFALSVAFSAAEFLDVSYGLASLGRLFVFFVAMSLFLVCMWLVDVRAGHPDHGMLGIALGVIACCIAYGTWKYRHRGDT